jgi:hypothetical protein
MHADLLVEIPAGNEQCKRVHTKSGHNDIIA